MDDIAKTVDKIESDRNVSSALSTEQILLRLEKLELAMRIQNEAFTNFLRAQQLTGQTPNLPQPTQSLPTNLSTSTTLPPSVPSKHTPDRSVPARKPTVTPSPPPPVRTSSLNRTREPSKLRRTSSASPSPVASETFSPSMMSPLSHDGSLSLSQAAEAARIAAASTGSQGLRQRKAAFQGSTAQKTKRSSDLAIEAARREMARAAARAAKGNRDESDGAGVLAWIGFLLLILASIGALVGGVMIMKVQKG